MKQKTLFPFKSLHNAPELTRVNSSIFRPTISVSHPLGHDLDIKNLNFAVCDSCRLLTQNIFPRQNCMENCTLKCDRQILKKILSFWIPIINRFDWTKIFLELWIEITWILFMQHFFVRKFITPHHSHLKKTMTLTVSNIFSNN